MKKSIITLFAIAVAVAVGVTSWAMFQGEDIATPVVATHTYRDDVLGFSITLPTELSPAPSEALYSVNPSYEYSAMGPGTSVLGVKFTIPSILSKGTNLSNDSYISVEHLSDAQECTAGAFIGVPTAEPDIIHEGVLTYSFATSSEAGAGNRYEEYVYARRDSSPCIAIRYFIHYAAIQNFPEGAVTEFDKAGLLATFDEIRRTLVFSK